MKDAEFKNIFQRLVEHGKPDAKVAERLFKKILETLFSDPDK